VLRGHSNLVEPRILRYDLKTVGSAWYCYCTSGERSGAIPSSTEIRAPVALRTRVLPSPLRMAALPLHRASARYFVNGKDKFVGGMANGRLLILNVGCSSPNHLLYATISVIQAWVGGKNKTQLSYNFTIFTNYGVARILRFVASIFLICRCLCKTSIPLCMWCVILSLPSHVLS
jgi:hypothetical protein